LRSLGPHLFPIAAGTPPPPRLLGASAPRNGSRLSLAGTRVRVSTLALGGSLRGLKKSLRALRDPKNLRTLRDQGFLSEDFASGATVSSTRRSGRRNRSAAARMSDGDSAR